MTKTVTLWYRAPVRVEVDVALRRVVAVNCSDEEAVFDQTDSASAIVDEALQIAESTDWPEWRYG